MVGAQDSEMALPIRKIAEAEGRGDFSSLWCGQNPNGCREIPAGEVVRRLAGVEVSRRSP